MNAPTHSLSRTATLQQRSTDDMVNALHEEATIGNIEGIKMFLQQLKSPPPSSDPKPWMQTNNEGHTPCHVALLNGHEGCGLEILEMDMELLCNIGDLESDCESLVYVAVKGGHSKFALKILRSSYSFSCKGLDGFNPLHYVPRCSEGEEICRLLLEKKPGLIKINSDGFSVFHTWAEEGKLWPFEGLLKSLHIIKPITEVRRVFVELINATTSKEHINPLHVLAKVTSNELDVVQIAKLFIDACKEDAATKVPFPWLVKDNQGGTPLSEAIKSGNENLAMYILLLEDYNALIKCPENALFLAIEKGCHEVADLIMEIVEKQKWTHLLINHQRLNVFHLAPLCTESFIENLLKRHQELLEPHEEDRTTVLHSWVKKGKLWPFEYILQNKELDPIRRNPFIKLISCPDYEEQNNPLHVAATNARDEATDRVVELLIEAYKKETPNWQSVAESSLPWFHKNKDKEGALHLAIRNRREKLALNILSSHIDRIKPLLDSYEPEQHKILFLAIENNCHSVAKKILGKLGKKSRNKYLTDSSDGRSILHLAPHYTDQVFLTWLIQDALVPINVKDKQGSTPLHEAIREKNILLTETLLNEDKISYNIKDQKNETARDLLERISRSEPEWDQMCNNLVFDPRMKTKYFKSKTDLLHVRNTLSVVAALVATITFTAGFTIPGGFNQDTGEAILAKKVAFLVFLISDTLAMCCSMLVLICLIWSMVYDSNKSLFLIDRSMMLLMISLYSTLLTFMSGVYVVISPKSLWPAIVIIVMCSLIGISANRTLLYKVLNKLIPSAKKEYGNPFHLMELGKCCPYGGGNSCLKCNRVSN